MISTVLVAESMGLEPKGTVICCYLLLYVVICKALEFQRLERETLGTAEP